MKADLRELSGRLTRLGIDRRFALDLGSVIMGVRRRALMHVPAAIAGRMCALANEYSLRLFATKRLRRVGDSDSREGLLYDQADLEGAGGEEWVELWFDLGANADSPEDSSPDARDLGYPDCCIAAYGASRGLAGHYQRYLRCSESGHWEINRLSAVFCDGFFMPDFFPCSLACTNAVMFSRRFLQVAASTMNPTVIDRWSSFMKGIYLIAEGRLICWIRWDVSHGEVRVEVKEAVSVQLSTIANGIPPLEAGVAVIVPMRHLDEIGRLGDRVKLRMTSSGGGDSVIECRYGIADGRNVSRRIGL